MRILRRGLPALLTFLLTGAALVAAAPASATLIAHNEGVTNADFGGNIAYSVKPLTGDANSFYWYYINDYAGGNTAVCYRYAVNNGTVKAPNGNNWAEPTIGGNTSIPAAGASICEGPIPENDNGYVYQTVSGVPSGNRVTYCAQEYYKFSNIGWQKSGAERCQTAQHDAVAPSGTVTLKQNGNDVTATNDPASLQVRIDYSDALTPPLFRGGSNYGSNYLCTVTNRACNGGDTFNLSTACSAGTKSLTQTFTCPYPSSPADGTYFTCFQIYDGTVIDALPSNAGQNPSSTNQNYNLINGVISCDSVTIDRVAPDTSITSGPTEGSTGSDSTPTFGFTGTGSPASFECSVDNGAYSACTSTFTTSTLGNGAHSFRVRAKDAAGNVDATPATRNFTISGGGGDTTPPQTTLTGGPADGSSTTDPTPHFSFESSEGGSTFQCQVDGGGYSACGSPKTVGPLALGQHTFQVRATDASGNTDASPATSTFSVVSDSDTTPPDTSITDGPEEGATIANRNPDFSFVSTEGGSTFTCSIDGGAFSACSSPHSTGSLADGTHTFAVRARDAAGNVDASPASRTFAVAGAADTTPPKTTITKSPAKKTKSKRAKFSFEADEHATFECSLDGKSSSPCDSPFSAKVGKGKHTFEVVATDDAGLADATPAKYAWTVKVKKKKHH